MSTPEAPRPAHRGWSRALIAMAVLFLAQIVLVLLASSSPKMTTALEGLDARVKVALSGLRPSTISADFFNRLTYSWYGWGIGQWWAPFNQTVAVGEWDHLEPYLDSEELRENHPEKWDSLVIQQARHPRSNFRRMLGLPDALMYVVVRIARSGMLSVILSLCGFVILMPLYLSAGRKTDWHTWTLIWLVVLTPVAVSLSSWLLLQVADTLRQGFGEILHSTLILTTSAVPVMLGNSIRKSIMVAFKLDPFERVADWIHKG